MIITHKLQQMDLAHKQNTIRVDVVQDDKYSRDVEFTLTENGVAWQIPDGATAVVRYKKPDGTGGNYDTLPDGSTAYQINGNVLTVALAPQVCTVQGQVQLSVGLIHGNAEINTFSVNIIVQPNPGATYQSEDYIKLSGAVPNSGWTPNMYLGTDASGNVVAKEGTSGGGGTSSKDGVGIQSVEQTTTSTEDGGTNIVTVTKTDGTSSTFQVKNGSKGSTGPKGTDGKSAYQYAQDGGYTGTEAEFAAKLAAEKFANPNSLTFTGAVTGSYDGSEDLTVEIPSGGGGSNLPIPTAEDVGKVPVVQGDLSFGLGEIGVGDWEVIADQTLVEEAASVSFDFDVTYRRLWFIVYGVPASGSNATLDVRFNGSIDKQRIQLSNGLQSFNTSDGVNKRAAQIYLEKINGYIAFALCSVNGGNENPNAIMYSPSIDSKKVDWIDIYKVVFYAANTSFSAGSIFKLWGCK